MARDARKRASTGYMCSGGVVRRKGLGSVCVYVMRVRECVARWCAYRYTLLLEMDGGDAVMEREGEGWMVVGWEDFFLFFSLSLTSCFWGWLFI